MIIRFEKKDIYVSIVLLLTLSAILFYSYIAFYKPAEQSVSQVNAELKMTEKALAIQQNQVQLEDEAPRKSAAALQKVIPSEPFVEQFILDIEKAEVKSNSLVQQMTFGAGEITQDESSSALQNYNDMEKSYSLTRDNAEAARPLIEMPEGLQKETIHLSVESSTYFDLEMFLATLQEGERYVELENLTFTGPAERTMLNDFNTDKLTYTLDVSIYYHTAIDELKKDLPILETPPPGNKQNPFSN